MSESNADPGFTFVDRRQRAEPEPTRESPVPSPSSGSAGEPFGTPDGPPRADLPSLCIMLYSDALVHLGQIPDPVTGQRHMDLDQVRFAIDLLETIKDKTNGNRTPEESEVLDEILSALQMGFVRATRGR